MTDLRASFTDGEGRRWIVRVDVAAVRRCRAATGVNLYGLLGGDALQRLLEDPLLAADCLWAILEPSARDAGVAQDQFDRALSGDALGAGVRALLEGAIDFFPDPKDRQTLREVVRRIQAAAERVREQQLERIRAGAIEAALLDPMPSRPPSGPPPESAASTPPA